MKLKASEKVGTKGKIQSLFRHKKSLTTWLLRLAGLSAIAVLFVGVLGYGAYLKKVGETTYYKAPLLRIAELDFPFMKKLVMGETIGFDKVKIAIKPKRLAELQQLREQALEKGIISDSIKAVTVPGTLTYNGKVHAVKISLTGDMAMHLNDPVKWPVQVSVKGEDTVEGMKRFRLLLPPTGGYLTDWLGGKLLSNRGLISLKKEFVDVTWNGKSIGILYLEEQFDPRLVGNERFAEGVMFKVGQELSFYDEDKVAVNPTLKAQMLSLRKKWNELSNGKVAVEQFFDLQKTGKLFAVTDLMNQKHPLLTENLVFYFNPQTELAEPIPAAFKNLNDSDPFTFSSFLEKPQMDSKWHYLLTQDPSIQLFSNKLDFKRAYIQEADSISQRSHVDELLIQNGTQLNYLLKKVYQDWPGHDLPTKTFYGNAKFLQYVIYPDLNEIIAYFKEKEEEHLSIQIKEQQCLPIEVAYVSWRDSVFFYPEESIVLDARSQETDTLPKEFKFQIPPDLTWSDSLLPELKVYYHMLGLQDKKKTVLVFPWSYEKRQAYVGNPVARNATYQNFDFIEEMNDTLLIPEGKWTLSEDLIFPKNKQIKIAAGAQIDMVNHAKMISYSTMHSMGTKEKPIMVYSSDTTAQGWLVIRAPERSTLSHTHFDHISAPKEYGWALPGAVTFYESPVNIQGTSFASNQWGDDFLNIVRSDFSMDDTHFRKINADAFDCDFCTGTVTNSSFTEIGNDGIDISGTKIEIRHVAMSKVGDKGLSAGENSDMDAKWIEITDAEIGVTSKDRSRITLSDTKLLNARIGITLFEKKTEFGPAYIAAERIDIVKSEIPHLIEQNSVLILDGATMPVNKQNVKEILYGAEYGKASR